MATETVTINQAAEAPTTNLVEEAAAKGIDVNSIDPNEYSQTATPGETKILGKFKSQEDLERAYTELEKKLGAGNKETSAESNEQEAQTEEGAEEQAAEGEKSAEEQAKETVENAGLNFEELSTKYWENGEQLEEADYTKLEKAGIPKALVDQYIEGQKAQVALQRQSVFNEVGGESNYSAMTEWAKSRLTEAEISAYNDAVNGNDMNNVLFAVKGLKARYEAERGSEPRQVISGRTSSPQVARYESTAQLMEDMRNPKYNTDPAYRAQVEAKLARSNIMG